LLSSKISNLAATDLTVTGVTNQSAVQTLVSNANVDHIILSTTSAFSQSYNTFSASSNPLLSGKVSNLGDVDLTVTGVRTAAAAATLAANTDVDHITLFDGVTSLSASQFSTKITNTGLTVTGADATNALTLAADSHVN